MDKLNLYLADAQRYIEEGNSVQASEKIYKIVEYCIKLLSENEKLDEWIKAKEEGRWWSKLLERAVTDLSKKLGEKKLLDVWEKAAYLHAYGFHEEQLDIDRVKENFWIVDWVINYTKNYLNAKNG